MTNRVICVSFADGAFSGRRNAFKTQAEQTGFFDEVEMYDFSRLPADFQQAHGEFIQSNARGFGYWIWKPEVVYETLKRARPSDVIVYLDAGFSLNADAHRRFKEYIEITRDSPHGMLSFQNIFTEGHWTKSDLAQKLGISSDHRHMKTSQFGSGFFMITPSVDNIDIINHWREVATAENYRYSDDSPSVSQNHPNFREHRHDQSIFSLLRKMRGSEITYYEVQSYKGRFEEISPLLPALATRSRI